MNEKYNVYLVSDSTGETLDRIFLSLKSQFSNFEYEKKEFAFIRTEQQIDKIIKECNKIENSIILYTIVETKLAKYLANQSEKNSVPCFGVLGNLILSFSKLLNQKAIHKPSAQHVLDDDYYKRIEAIQFTMSHDDGKKVDDINEADVILLGVSRTSKTPTSIYLANRGYKTVNIPLVLEQKIPEDYISCTGRTYSIKEFINYCNYYLKIDSKWIGKGLNTKLINKKTNKVIIKVNPKYFRPSEVNYLKGDFKKAKKEINWKPKISLKELVEIMLKDEIKYYNK